MKMGVEQVLDFCLDSRRSGTTSLIKEVCGLSDVTVVLPTRESAMQFGKEAVSFSGLANLRGRPKKPFLLDNYAVISLCQESIREMDALQLEIAGLNGDKKMLQVKVNIGTDEVKFWKGKWQKEKNGYAALKIIKSKNRHWTTKKQ